MKIKIIITAILLFCSTIINAQTYKSLVQVDRNGYGNLKTLFAPTTIRFNENSIWIKIDELNEPMELFIYKTAGVKDKGEYVETTYVFSDNTISYYGYSFLLVKKYLHTQIKEKYKFDITFTILMVDMETFNSTGVIEPTRYTIFYSILKNE
jgi:hypothetical protein